MAGDTGRPTWEPSAVAVTPVRTPTGDVGMLPVGVLLFGVRLVVGDWISMVGDGVGDRRNTIAGVMTMARKRKARKGNRTRKGYVSAAARRKHGTRKGRFPVFDAKSANSALRLRGHGNKKAVLSKVSRYANKTGNKALKAKVARARKVDRKR